ncbi:MAG: RagB/SusD family nutrient uptake outer membrane protein [Prevotellaceae bacterium]|nr:RagB/SusD family nutrient uptake outer membrane protein [Prevotellaceae bacterium]
MKTIIKNIICFATVMFTGSCNYLDVVPDQVATFDNIFSDRYTVEQYLATCYWGIPKHNAMDNNPAIFGSMEMVLNRESQTAAGMQIGLGRNSATSSEMNYWGSTSTGLRTLYGGIRDCNVFLDNVETVADLTRDEKDRMIAEIKTVKAYMHFYLLCYYGPICPLRESVPVNESTTGIRVYREKIDDCFEYIIQLLDEAIDSEDLPLVILNNVSELGRFTQPAAYMLKAKVLVYWASPLFNGNREYNGFLDHNDEPFFNQTEDPARWTRAAEACKKAIEICTRANIRLFQKSDYITKIETSDTTLLVNTLRSAVTEQWVTNVEKVWGSQNDKSEGEALERACLPQLEPGSSPATGRVSAPFSTVELFYSNHGVPISEDREWVLDSDKYVRRYSLRTGDSAHINYIELGEQTGAVNFDREPRFYATFGFDRGKWYGNHYANSPADDSKALFPRDRWGEYSSQRVIGQYNATGYFIKKLVGTGIMFRNSSTINDLYYTGLEMRYADLLLLTAEALNETTEGEKTQPSDEVYQYVDAIRTRAGLEGVIESWEQYSTDPSKPLTKEGMRDIIRRERNIELACEGMYYWDSRRWKTAMREQNRLIQGWDVMSSDVAGYYTPTTIYIQRFTFRDYFAPIPESDLINNPQLIQNPGW